MIGWLIFAGYMVVAIILGRIFSPVILDLVCDNGDPITDTDVFMSRACGTVAGLLFPVTVPFALVMYRPKKSRLQFEREAGEKAEYIAKLERELGIR